jgi:hypothetical protein
VNTGKQVKLSSKKGNIIIMKKEAALSEIFSNDVVLQIMAEFFQDNCKPED